MSSTRRTLAAAYRWRGAAAAVAEAAAGAEAVVAGPAGAAVDAAVAAFHGALAACAKPSCSSIKLTYADRYGRARQRRPGRSMFELQCEIACAGRQDCA